jgi:hypothetical protein
VVIRGTVRDSATKSAIPSAQISVVGSGRVSLSDSVGRYAVDLASGTEAHLAVIRLGFVPQSIDVTNITADTVQLDITLTQLPQALSTVSVEARPSVVPPEYQYTHRFDKFFQDRANNSTRGTFYTRKQLVAYGSLARALRALGATVTEGRAGVITSVEFPDCLTPKGIFTNPVPPPPPTLIIDGRQTRIDMLNGLSLIDVEMMEVFPSAASSPASARGDGCGALVIFTRQRAGAG